MSKNIFEQSTQDRLADVFKGMYSPKSVIEESKESPKSEAEADVDQNDVTVEEETNQEENSTQETTSSVGSKFDEVFNNIFQEGEGDDCCGCGEEVCEEEYSDEEMGSEDYSEGEMVSIPRALIDELYAYIEDTMGSEDESDVDDVDFELPEEGADVEFAKNKMAYTKEYGSPKQKDKTGTSSSKKGKAVDKNKARTGKPQLLKNLLGCYTSKGSPKQKNDTKVKDTPINK